MRERRVEEDAAQFVLLQPLLSSWHEEVGVRINREETGETGRIGLNRLDNGILITGDAADEGHPLDFPFVDDFNPSLREKHRIFARDLYSPFCGKVLELCIDIEPVRLLPDKKAEVRIGIEMDVDIEYFEKPDHEIDAGLV
jgi:hypothetical protein